MEYVNCDSCLEEYPEDDLEDREGELLCLSCRDLLDSEGSWEDDMSILKIVDEEDEY